MSLYYDDKTAVAFFFFESHILLICSFVVGAKEAT